MSYFYVRQSSTNHPVSRIRKLNAKRTSQKRGEGRGEESRKGMEIIFAFQEFQLRTNALGKTFSFAQSRNFSVK